MSKPYGVGNRKNKGDELYILRLTLPKEKIA